MNNLTLLTAAFLIVSCTAQEKDERNPEAGLADLKAYDGLEVTLFASEPMFSNPTNIDIDARGRVWVTEAFNYRNQYNPKNPIRTEGDRIMILEDTDGDGKADNSKVFYQGTDVNAALGICVLGNKVIVSCSPNVFVFTDDNGDDVPDKKEILFQGIRGIDHDHAIHAFSFAHDGRLYFNMGNEAGVLIDAKGDTVVDINGKKVVANGKPFRDGLVMRADPDGSNVEVIAHNFRNNYELTVDPYGTIWQSDNDDDGNKATRINFVMEYGNYGFKDEMTGASWQSRRTNMEKETPLRHWHLNDPGVVPNLLQTGSGSPTGMTMYEGTMLPSIFQGQMIHAEPGHNVIRSYPVENDGAGYKASIIKLLEGQADQWFRPADVTVAPDGSVFVADWYDPGVGGHAMGDPNRGRIYRIATPGTKYEMQPLDVSTSEGAISALLNPNPATRYLGWTALEKMGSAAEDKLKQLWSGNNPRHRAQAFWLLIRVSADPLSYVQAAFEDTDANIRILGIRGLRLLTRLHDRNAQFSGKLVNDPSPQVRREIAIALRGNKTEEAARMWSALANQYDGNDRWYLEALGIGAEGNWDLYFKTWKGALDAKSDEDIDRDAAQDIVWRSRAKAALPILGTLIANSNEEDMLRYYRAFDFHKDPSRQQALASLAVSTSGKKQLYALRHMNTADIRMTPALRTALINTLTKYKDQLEFVELATVFALKEKKNELLEICINYPDSAKGRQAAWTLITWGEDQLLYNTLHGADKDRAVALTRCVDAHMYNNDAIALMEGVMMDSSLNVELRKLAVRAFSGPWEAEDHLLAMAKDNRIPADMKPAAAGMFNTVWRGAVRTEAAKYLPMPGNKEGKPLPPIDVLSERTGTVANGKVVFTSLCATCHTVKDAGVAGSGFGPDLSEIGSKLSREAMYKAILFPDQGISFGFEGYNLKLNDGSTAFGRIVSETGDQIDLQYMDNKQTVEKSKVASRTKLANSLMPGDLQLSMTEKELVDLVEYLMQLSKTQE